MGLTKMGKTCTRKSIKFTEFSKSNSGMCIDFSYNKNVKEKINWVSLSLIPSHSKLVLKSRGILMLI